MCLFDTVAPRSNDFTTVYYTFVDTGLASSAFRGHGEMQQITVVISSTIKAQGSAKTGLVSTIVWNNDVQSAPLSQIIDRDLWRAVLLIKSVGSGTGLKEFRLLSTYRS